MTLLVSQPVRNIGKLNTYEKRVSKYKGGRASKDSEKEKGNEKDKSTNK